MRFIDTKLIKEKSKKGLIQPVYDGDDKKSKQGHSNDISEDDLLALLTDSTVNGIILTNVAAASKGSIIAKGDKAKVKKAMKWLKDNKEHRKRRKTFANLFTYQNVFHEIIYKGKQANGYDILETRQMKIIDDDHGVIKGYVQESDKERVLFEPNEVVHMKMLEITSNNWGYAYNKNLIRIVNAKLTVQNYLHWLVKTNQFRTSWIGKDIGDKAEDFLTYVNESENFPTKHLVVEGEIQAKIVRDFKDAGSFISLINYYNSEIYRLMQTPPIVAGTVDNSNRSNSEAQLKSTYWTWIEYCRAIYIDYLQHDILTLFGITDVELIFTPLDSRITKDEIEVARGLQELGMNNKGLKKHLETSGFLFVEGVDLEDNENGSISGNKLFAKPPSRQPQDNFDNQKSGSESSTREDQIGQKSKFSSYPYTY